jgi:23S rRNA (adenine2503-C2)-methyltransferase
MPINNKYPLETLLDALKNFRLRQHRRITFEYVMLDGVNDTPACATELITLCKELDKPLLVNLIPYNPWPGSPFKRSSVETIKKFRNQLTNSHIAATIRKTRGEDVLAACGQLRTETSGRNTVFLEYPSVVAQYGTPEQRQKVKVSIKS